MAIVRNLPIIGISTPKGLLSTIRGERNPIYVVTMSLKAPAIANTNNIFLRFIYQSP